MALSDEALRERALRAYERGRLRLAFRRGAWALPVVALMLAVCPRSTLTAGAAALLPAAAVALLWRGEAWGRAVKPGLLAGAAPLALPATLTASGHVCVFGACLQVCVAGCLGAGLLAGLVLGVRALALRAGRGPFLLAASALVLLVGVPACAFAGVLGVLGMAAGLSAAASTPTLVVSARAS